MIGRAELALGRWRIYVRRHWDVALWRRRFFWLSIQPFQSGVCTLLAGIEITVYRVRCA